MCGFSTAQGSAPPTTALFQGLLYLLCTWSYIRCFPFRTAVWGKVEYLCVDEEIKCQVGQVPQTARAVSGRARTRPCPGPPIPFLPAISVSWASRDLFPQSPSFLLWGTGAQRAQAWEGQMGRLARLRASSSWLTVSMHQQETASCWFWGLYKGLQSECVGPDASAQGQHWPSVTAATAVAAEPVPALWCAGECAISTPCLRPGWALGQEGILGDSIWEGRLRSKHLDFGLVGRQGSSGRSLGGRAVSMS